ncbi:MAG TPA: hypothetical protein VF914_09705 [Chloroflexia bacterium]|jgi:hypothetical protein
MDAVDWIVNGTALFMGAIGLIAVLVGAQLFNEYRNRDKPEQDRRGQPSARV